MFVVKQIVWAKTKGYPWWPAEINKIPTEDHNFFKVTFIGQTNHALLQQKAVRKYLDHYDNLKTNNYKGLQNSIEQANIEVQKRKNIIAENQNKLKNSKIGSEKSKRIKKGNKNKKKLTFRQKFLKEIKPLNDNLKKLQESEKEKSEKQPPEQSSCQRPSEGKKASVNSEIQSVYLSQPNQSSSIQVNELEYMRNVDRKKIEETQQELFSFITFFNSNIYDRERECFQLIQKIQRDQFKSEQLLQSKITNMITYIHKKLVERTGTTLKKDEIQKINKINHSLKEKVLSFLFDSSYYDQYLKRMEKNGLLNNEEKQIKEKSQPKNCLKKYRRYKRKIYPLRKKLNQAK